MTMNIIYKNASNSISAREIDVIHEDDTYIDAVCYASGKIKTFRKDRILEAVNEIDSQATREKVEQYQKKYEIIHHVSYEQWKNRDRKPEICFTGFKSKDKTELVKHAVEHGFFVRTGVSTSLSFLVCGETSGPAKVKNARQQGVLLLNKDAYLHLAATGEIMIE
jgi:NAD-dependent DNA ligase